MFFFLNTTKVPVIKLWLTSDSSVDLLEVRGTQIKSPFHITNEPFSHPIFVFKVLLNSWSKNFHFSGNIVLTDKDYIILNVLRPHSDGEEVRFYVREKYPVDLAKLRSGAPSEEMLREMFIKEKQGEQMKKILVPKLGKNGRILTPNWLCFEP